MTSHLQEETVRDYIRAYNAFDVDGMLQHLHQDVCFENISGGEVNLTTHGLEEFRKQAENAKDFFREREQKVLSLQSTNSTTEAHIDYTGVLARDLPNGLQAGTVLQLSGKSTFHFQDDKIIRLVDES
ncbi:nuclear transport factor 2 family protein [Sabulibacter ruber]|uniref:nuclear transport factor 2 family protein n=1 Tax=Sabulibacter ruber TaxID=2811901 RepID=UPI001A97970D|nr:nuclear transport factor 2 family protein [Sabulibacter ruber]